MIAAARDEFGLEKITVIPVGDPAHKTKNGLLPFKHRMAMTQLLLQDEPGVEISDVEDRLSKAPNAQASYMVNTLRKLFPGFDQWQQTHGWRIPFIIGVDALNRIGTWHEAKVLVDNLLFLVAPRNGEALQKQVKLDGQPVPLVIEEMTMPETPISSTQIRNAVQQGIRLPALARQVGDACARYILDNRLFQTP